MTQVTTKQVKQAIRDGHAWPGGYTIYLIADDCQPICTKCARQEWKNICDSMYKDIKDGWNIIGIDTLQGDKEHEGDCTCALCDIDIWTI